MLAALLVGCSTSDDDTLNKVPGSSSEAIGDDGIGTVLQLRQGIIPWAGDSTKASSPQKFTQFYSFSYRSKDAYGDSIRLTVLIGWPDGPSTAVKPTTLLTGCHITITDDKSAPSNFDTNNLASDTGMLLMHATSGTSVSDNALVIIPDYEGYGGTAIRSHPYLCQELTAQQIVDAIRAGLKFFKQKGYQMADGWKSAIVGYSQGGAVAMATHRLIEQTGLSEELHFCGSVCGDGPYDLMATFQQYIEDDKLYMPVVVPLILKGLCENSPTLANYQPKDFLTDQFVNTGILDMITGKRLSTDEINDKLISYAENHPDKLQFRYDDEGSYLTVNQVLRSECIAFLKGEAVETTNQQKLQTLVEVLKTNSVWGEWSGYDNWQPIHPVSVLHSIYDEVVPYENYLQASNYFKQYFIGRIYTNSFLNRHVSTGYMFFLIHYTLMLEEILGGNISSKNREITV